MGIKAFGFEICPLELITGDNGKLSTTKIWMNVANAMMTYIMYILRPTTIGWEYVGLFLAYGAVVGSSFIASKFFEMKFSAPQPPVTVNQPEIVNVAGDAKIKGKKK